MVLVSGGQLVNLHSNMICDTTVHVPVRVHLVGGGRSNNTLSRTVLLALKALPTVHYLLFILPTQLAIGDIKEAYFQPIKRIDMALEGIE